MHLTFIRRAKRPGIIVNKSNSSEQSNPCTIGQPDGDTGAKQGLSPFPAVRSPRRIARIFGRFANRCDLVAAPFGRLILCAVGLLALSLVGLTTGLRAQSSTSTVAIGTPAAFLHAYEAFKNRQLRSTNPGVLEIKLGYVKGLSRSFTATAGNVSIDLRSGRYGVTLTGLSAGTTYDVWLVDEADLGAASDAPGDRALLLTRVVAQSSNAAARGYLDDAFTWGFALDRVIVTPVGASGDVLASGSVNVLQKIYFGSASVTVGGVTVSDGARLSPSLMFAALVPDIASETTIVELAAHPVDLAFDADALIGAVTSAVSLESLIKQGSKLFFEETFKGNGRTCGTCHPASNNLTIDTAFIATLPANDPLFVAENIPALAQLERPALMRGFGLILENLDGLDNPTQKFVMRSVPHTLGMQVSLTADTSQLPTPAQMTGWGGDGAPGTGSLRDFATGAVTQHFPKTLARVSGVDFKLPTSNQLDAMEAFQLSLGRTADFDLSKHTFLDAGVQAGNVIFVNGTGNPAAGGRCQACHGNGGAIATNGLNRNFNTNVEDRINPARAVLNFPIDGGFGLTANPDGSFGNRAFNTPSLVEAADTAPFFHNNIAATLEAAVTFYTGPEFNTPRAPAGQFSFTATQIAQIANFLRALNTLQNIDVARRPLNELLSINGNPAGEIQPRLQSALNDTNDAIRVLNQTSLFPLAVAQLTIARTQIILAQNTNQPPFRRPIVIAAIAALDAARPLIVTVAP